MLFAKTTTETGVGLEDASDKAWRGSREIRLLLWVTLLAIVIGYFWLVVHLHPRNFFGLTQDDTLYFSSARAIAEGHGYILPSVPGTPPATKYPILYPWLLSWVWRWNPSFPANLSLALALNLSFGAAYLGAAFVFLRRLPGFSDAVAVMLTAACALDPTVLAMSANLLSDIPFAALTLTACIIAAIASGTDNALGKTICCGILSGLSILVRALGVPVAAGLFVALAMRSGWRKAAIYGACVSPFVVALFWRSMHLVPRMPTDPASACSGSWRMTWLYYTSYMGFWRADVLSHGVFWQTVRNNFEAALIQPGAYFINVSFIGSHVLALVLLVSLCAVAIRGGVRLTSSGGWQPIHFAAGFYLLPVLIWDYADMARFFLPFLPLMFAGIWREVQQVISLVRAAPRGNRGTERVIVAFFFCFVGAGLLMGAAATWSGEIRAFLKVSSSRAALLEERREAYAWLKENSTRDAKALAWEDVSLFLYSERQALRPVVFSPVGANRRDLLNAELNCMTSSAEPLGAKYWLVSDDDFGYEWEPANSGARKREKEIEQRLRPLFRSTHGGVRIYQLDAYGQPMQ
jgi:hypothetical protein